MPWEADECAPARRDGDTGRAWAIEGRDSLDGTNGYQAAIKGVGLGKVRAASRDRRRCHYREWASGRPRPCHPAFSVNRETGRRHALKPVSKHGQKKPAECLAEQVSVFYENVLALQALVE
jgi:hypothetical protein